MTKDIFLDADGRVVDAAQAVVMRRTVLDAAGGLVETSTWYATGYTPAEEPKKPTPRGWTPARGL
jgi:hypothetical protein